MILLIRWLIRRHRARTATPLPKDRKGNFS
jgi:hypothetical protein